MNFNRELQKTLTLAQRDLMKLLRDRPRIIASFIFPLIFLGFFGATMTAGLKQFDLGFNYTNYVFSGILLQTVFQSSLSGIVSLISDREKDFSMSIFVSPVSRYSIVLGKILGEALVGFVQIIGIVIFGYVLGVTFSLTEIIKVLPLLFLAAFVGGSFGLLVASRLSSSENAQRIFPFLIFPMIFSSGAFTPVNNLPLLLEVIKVINPLYYGVDLIRNVLFANSPALRTVTSNSFSFDLLVFVTLGIIFFLAGSYLFTQKEGNK